MEGATVRVWPLVGAVAVAVVLLLLLGWLVAFVVNLVGVTVGAIRPGARRGPATDRQPAAGEPAGAPTRPGRR